jgi:hypothetical protein
LSNNSDVALVFGRAIGFDFVRTFAHGALEAL